MIFLRTIIIGLIVFAFAACADTASNNEASGNLLNAENKPIIQFEKVEHDFGKIFQGEKVSYIFKFKNIGSSDLLISNATASCGCTVPKFTRKPIKPGETGKIEVIFDSSNRHGRQVKTVSVWTNCQPSKTQLQITSSIVELN